MPTFRQLFIGGASGMELERRAYVIRKRAEHELAPRAPARTARAAKPSTSQAFPVDVRLQGHADHPAARGVLPRPAGRADRERAGHRALPVLHQHLPVVAAGASVPARRAQRRDQHRHRQRNWMRAREALIKSDVFGSRTTSTRSSRSAPPAPRTPPASTRCSNCCTGGRSLPTRC
jgi:glutamate synthase (NADPH/NADH) large chain